ncbi:UDP-N-acetylglucosamine--undecaprenyl-phosphate N-acetylglucosaminephosphotransferase [Vibrio sp. PID23_8]|uniref:UDP-N-acetylglucosamine--undecaprenyl-phosphate N-acetylglucosaminephosphotransferase n=1 Tax=Vibrio sp. PID23_8 TaxID=1583767 RepID=UPI000E6847B3|nr:UDP-N-acetylglucosamine--undecaprenyl-phosphate N-acetylglucosaminephosphotransferase [Vibrio sp. PID23_8]RIZ55053.1 UDP-phosphate N-acetylglucosaminyl 1-phosphate transferase [Vibrio sp. PID23_8]
MLFLFVFTLVIASISLLLLGKWARVIGLVDKPNSRKRHHGDIPLVGGIAIYVTLCVVCLWKPELIPNQSVYLLCCTLLVVIGALDDKFDIRASVRLVALIALSLWLIYSQKIAFVSLGNLFGLGNVSLGSSSWWFTMVAIIGAMTAFNMIDGLDGLLGALSSVTLLALSFLFFHQGENSVGIFCLVFITALVPYMICNLSELFGHKMKVFMGDAGSVLLGFTVIWLFLHASQPMASDVDEIVISPVNALWLVALPVMDMSMVIIRRCKKRGSPFKADRLHLHHICMRVGLSASQTLILLSMASLLFAAVGVWAEMSQIHERYMLLGFLLLFGAYINGMNRLGIWIKARKFKNIHV